MKGAKELVETLRKITGSADSVFPAIVRAIDKVNNVCEVEYSEMEIGDVRLLAIIKENSKGCKFYPAENSVVLVQRLGNKGEFFIAMYSEIESVVIEVNETKMEIKEGFLFQKQNETLKKILDDLLDGIAAIIVPTNVGPSGKPLNAATFTTIKTRVAQLLK